MAVEEQSQAPLRYMTVPEKIELGGGGVGGGVSREPAGGGGRYRPMKVLENYKYYVKLMFIKLLFTI